MIEAAKKLAAELEGRSDEIEQARLMPKDVEEKIKASDLCRALVPETYGGHQAHPKLAMQAVEEVAKVDASAGWVIGIGMSTGLNAAFLPAEFAKEIYGTPGSWAAGVFAPQGRVTHEGENYPVNGRWQWGSGTQNADWVVGGCFVVDDEGKPEEPIVSRMMFVKREDLIFHDTWHVAGLNGTGSGDFEMKDLLVPKGRSVALQTDRKQIEAPHYVFPSFALLASGIAATALGIGVAALKDFAELAGAKTPQFSQRSLAAKPLTQMDYAKAAAKIESARAFAHDATDEAFEAAKYADQIPDDIRARLRLSYANAVRESAEAVELLYRAGGGTSLFLSSPLQRHLRNINTATQHIMVSAGTLELTGRVLLGVKTDTAML